MEAKFVHSEKSKKKLFFEGHLFYKDRENLNKVYWKCEHFKSKCKARAITKDNVIVKHTNMHNHIADAGHVEAQKVVSDIRNAAVVSCDTPNYIVASISGRINQSVAAKLPSVPNLKRVIVNARAKQNSGPVQPVSRRDIVFPEEFTRTEKGEPFLLFDSGPEDDRMLIFATAQNLQILRSSNHWHGDGTFKTVPLLFEQLYTIHALRENKSIPLVYILLANKTQYTYARMLREIKNLIGVFQPESFMVDFEQSMLRAIEREFPETQVKGCFFHFGQCIWRKIQACGLKQRYENDPEFALRLRMLSALAFVPIGAVTNAFESLCRDGIFNEEMFPVVDYFEDTWIGRPNNILIRRPPSFSHNLWNCHNLVLTNRPKTNNNLEGWHRGFQSTLNSFHPGFWLFVKAIKKEQSLNELKIEQYLSGQDPPTKKKKYRDYAERLFRVVSGWDENINIVEYLRAIAHNLSY